jgi:hypothetical protein
VVLKLAFVHEKQKKSEIWADKRIKYTCVLVMYIYHIGIKLQLVGTLVKAFLVIIVLF